MDNISASNMRRLRVLTQGQPLIHQDNWNDLAAQGWLWKSNIKLDEYTVAVQTIKQLQKEHKRENVTIGHPFNRDVHRPNEDDILVGIYIKDITKIVISLHRDLAKWERLTKKELEDL